jgi:transposase
MLRVAAYPREPNRSCSPGRMLNCRSTMGTSPWRLEPLTLREGTRYCRPVPVAARTRAHSVRRREQPDPGAGSVSAAASHAPGQIERRTHDYTRHGTLTLFAALDAATGKVIGRCYPRHRGREFLSFLREIERNVPPELEVRLIMDNYATDKTPAIRKWLGARPRRHGHFTPTASSWVNLVERFFADITEKQIRRGVHCSTEELETAIRSYIEGVNDDPKPFRWTKSADNILATIKRFCLKSLEIAAAQTEIAPNSESGH